jgi:hypothetical protein
MRYTSAGNLDTTFGTGGIVATNWGEGDRYMSVVFKNDRIYAVGGSKAMTGTFKFIIAKYLP